MSLLAPAVWGHIPTREVNEPAVEENAVMRNASERLKLGPHVASRDPLVAQQREFRYSTTEPVCVVHERDINGRAGGCPLLEAAELAARLAHEGGAVVSASGRTGRPSG